MKFTLTQRKQTASFRIAGLMLAPLWLMLAAANTSAYAQTSDTAAATSTTTSSSADWTEFHRDNMQRWNPYETVLGVGNVGSLQLAWQSGVCCGGTGFGLAPPAVANGVVYVGSGSSNGDFSPAAVYALNASTGATLWSYTTGGLVFGSPAVANGVVYVGSVDSNVYALNAGTGAKLWSYSIGNPIFPRPLWRMG
jgi:outer membrane protein assembly factor BamB